MAAERHRGTAAMAAMMGLYFLVLLAVGILRPIRNALALDGLGRTDFYKVYLVSALVMLFVPVLNRLSDKVQWRRLIPGIALFFALNLLVFRMLYVEGSTVFGLAFYGWYDLFAAGLVTQLFMVTQLFFHARLAKRAYPLVITGGALGASAGGALTGFLAERLGTPNLMLVAAVAVGLFAVALAAVWSIEGMVPTDARPRRHAAPEPAGAGVRAVFADRQVQLIMALVLITILVKQLVDYQFNTLTKEVFVDRDAISAFQGKFNAATQWLPIVVLAAMRVPLQRWGVGFVVLILPVAMFLTNVGLVLLGGFWVAVAAKGMEGSLRYSAERTGREILYVPVREEIKLKAKAYVDVAVEKGLGKVVSALVIFVLLAFADFRYVALMGAVLSLAWIVLALTVRREYVRALARAVEQRFASLTGTFASLADASTAPLVRGALAGGERQIAFALDLIGQAQPEDARAFAPDLTRLLGHARADVRRRAFELLARVPDAVDEERLRALLEDEDADVREVAVRALLAAHRGREETILQELLRSEKRPIRIATLACLARGELALNGGRLAGLPPGAPACRDAGASAPSAEERAEIVLSAAALRPPDAVQIIAAHIDDDSPTVAAAALECAGLLREPALYPTMVEALRRRALRQRARDALALQGTQVVGVLGARLLDSGGSRTVRHQIPSVLARIPAPEAIAVLIRCVLSTETDQILDHRAIKALSKIRARLPSLVFDARAVDALMRHSLAAAEQYAGAREALRLGEPGPRTQLLLRTIEEAWAERREEVFRCLGLRYPSAEVYRCYLAVVRGQMVPRANALEWLESSIGFRLFRSLAAVLDDRRSGTRPDLGQTLRLLAAAEDRWLAACAAAAAEELHVDLGQRHEADMDLVEKVLLLQRTDVLADARSAHLALVAAIAEQITAEPGTVLIETGKPSSGLYVVVSGEVEVTGAGSALSFTDGMGFGAWSLIDALPSVAEARALQPTRLLHIDREEFLDLMTDYPELAIGMLQGLARRVRALAA